MSTDLLTRPTMRTIVKAMNAQDLAACAQDVISWQDKGVLADGPLHALAARFMAETGIDEMSSMQQAEAAVLREASLRFIATQTMTKIARIVTEDVDDTTRRVVLMCALDSDHRLVDGEWMGYCVDRTGRAPFIMTAVSFEYDGYTEAHNFAKRPIIPSELFTIADHGENDGSTYRVRSVSVYSAVVP